MGAMFPVGHRTVRRVVAAVFVIASGSAAGCSAGQTSPPATAPSAVTSSAPATAGEGSSPAAVDSVPAATESAPPGDIPDNLAFIRYRNSAGHYSFAHPEGWNETVSGTTARFADKLNSVTLTSEPTTLKQADPAAFRGSESTRLQATVPAFELLRAGVSRLPAGQAVHLVYRRNSVPDPVTGRVYRDEVEEYLVVAAGRLIRMELSGPVGADNVDAYRTMSQSLRSA